MKNLLFAVLFTSFILFARSEPELDPIEITINIQKAKKIISTFEDEMLKYFQLINLTDIDTYKNIAISELYLDRGKV